MNENSKPKMPVWMSAVACCAMAVSGLVQITSGLRRWEAWSIVEGVGLCLLPSYVYEISASDVASKRRTLGYRLAAATYAVAVALVMLGVSAPLIGINPVIGFAGGSHVTPSTLVGHPFIYNHQQVETDGYIVTNDRGWCMLEVGEANGGVIVLAARGLRCKTDSTQRIWASLSGTFEVIRTSKGSDIPYALIDVRGIPATLRGADTGIQPSKQARLPP